MRTAIIVMLSLDEGIIYFGIRDRYHLHRHRICHK